MGLTAGIILSRMTSSRLPGKAIVDICGQPNLQLMISRVRRARLLDSIVVATTENESDAPIVQLCQKLGVRVFRGDEANVLSRVHAAAAALEADTIVRMTADCPLIDPALIDLCIETFRSGHYDYVANGHVRSFPDGLDVEVLARSALDLAHEKALHPFLREHVTPYIRGSHPDYGAGNFRIGNVKAPADFSHIRWTLDTAADLKILRALVARLPADFTWLEALAAATREPALLNLTPYLLKS